MGRYDKVQFMAWELHTGGPGGLPDPACDLAARLAFVADAAARAAVLGVSGPSTLKIFMGPALLLGGAGGYPAALLDRLRAGLQALARPAAYAHWLFVLGAGMADPARAGRVRALTLVQRGGAQCGPASAQEDGSLLRGADLLDADGVPLAFGIGDGEGGDVAPRRIQLLPSCGLRLDPAAVRLQPPRASVPSSYAFQCDGLWNLNGTPGCHTRLWGGRGALAGGVLRLVEASRDQAHACTELVTLASMVAGEGGPVPARALWNDSRLGSAGKVRVIVPLPL